MEEIRVIKWTISNYLELPWLIDSLSKELQQVSENFYASRSLIGCSVIVDASVEAYQRRISPERATMLIIDEENAIRRRIDRLERRYQPLAHQLTKDQLNQLQKSVQRPQLTELEAVTYKAIQEIEQKDIEAQEAKKKEARMMRL